MLIGTYQKRPNDEIDFGDAKYFFKPIIKDDEHSIHVCDVKNKDHAAKLLSIKDGYFEMKKDADAHVPPPRAPHPVSPTKQQTVADQVLNMSLRGLRTAMHDGQFSVADLRAAKQQELAKGGNERRDQVIAIIDQFITGLEMTERRAANPAIPESDGDGLAEKSGQDVKNKGDA